MVFDIAILLQPFLARRCSSIRCLFIRTGRNFTRTASPGEADSSKQNTTYIVSAHIAHYVGHGVSVPHGTQVFKIRGNVDSSTTRLTPGSGVRTGQNAGPEPDRAHRQHAAAA